MTTRIKYHRCSGKDCAFPEAKLWAAFYYNNKYYCLSCAEKLGLYRLTARIDFNFRRR